MKGRLFYGMSIPKELEEAYTQGYRQFSWIAPMVEESLSLRDYFENSRSIYQGQRFYWQTPDKQSTLVGLGKELEFQGARASITEIAAFIAANKATIYQNRTVEGAGAVLCGAFPFDETHSDTKEWGTMGQGLFYLPTFLLTQQGTHKYSTINFSAQSIDELVGKWQTLTAQLSAICQLEAADIATVGIIQQEEVAVNQWMDLVNKTVSQLTAPGPLEKVVLARQMKVVGEKPFQSEAILRNLQSQQTMTYFFALEHEAQLFIGASPERLLKATKDAFLTASIAGSVSRGTTVQEDQQLGEQLLHDLKNRQEHQIVVDRIVTELSKLTTADLSIQQPELLKNRDIQHLFLPIEGNRKPGIDFLEGIQQLHPTPALGGEPKELALQWLRSHEPLQRGLYGAPIGWLAIKENIGEFAVGIRSALVVQETSYLFAGCGIVKESQAAAEREETRIKFRPMLRGIGGTTYDQPARHD